MSDFYGKSSEGPSVAQYDISVIPNDFNVLTIYSLLEKQVITMPAFQRNYVWDRKRASKFIESLILGLPVPQIFLYQIDKNKYGVIDGQQRLMSIYFFIKQRFPKPKKRVFLRKEFDEKGAIIDSILNCDSFFQDFTLQFSKLENGDPHPLNGKKYSTLEEAQQGSFNLMPVRCMSVRQNQPEDNSSIYEIFNRLNTGGLNLSPQEIRGCIYNSEFYKEMYKLNADQKWRRLLGKPEEDDKFRDVEIILRSFALYSNYSNYSGNMNQFLNNFSKQAQKYSLDKVQNLIHIYKLFLDCLDNVSPEVFLTKSGSFNVSFFDSIFVVIAEKLQSGEKLTVSQAVLENLRQDPEFSDAITHSTSHAQKVKLRIQLARKHITGYSEE